MKGFLLRLLSRITSAINQLPSPEEKGISQKKEYFEMRPKRNIPPHVKAQKRKGSVHSDERIFNHPRE